MAPTPLDSPLLTSPAAKQPTRFFNPVVVGGRDLVGGQALLCYRFDLDYHAGSFNAGPTVPGSILTFPAGAILWKLIGVVTTPFNGAGAVVKFGTNAGGNQLGSVDLTVAGSAEGPASPAIIGPVPAGGKVYVSAALGTSTAGQASLAILYMGAPAAPWR